MSDKTINRSLPQALEAERAVLGSILLASSTIPIATETLTDKHFFHPPHKIIFRAIVALNQRDNIENVDLTILTNALDRTKQLAEVGGPAYIAGLEQSVTSTSNIRHYAKIVYEKFLLRQLIETANTIAEQVYKGSDDACKILDFAEKSVYEISQGNKNDNKGLRPIGNEKELFGWNDMVAKKIETVGEYGAIATPWGAYNRHIGRLSNGVLTVWAAPTSVGKTIAAVNQAISAAAAGKSVLFFSSDMPINRIYERMASAMQDIQASKWVKWDLYKEDTAKIFKFSNQISNENYRLIINDAGRITPSTIGMQVRNWARRHPVDLIIVDYLQRIQGDEKMSKYNRETTINFIAQEFKNIAKEFNVPVLATAQTRRLQMVKVPFDWKYAVQYSDIHTIWPMPHEEHLRESGAISQEASCVMQIWRIDYQQPDKAIFDPYDRIETEFHITKNSFGKTGMLPMWFDKNYYRFIER